MLYSATIDGDAIDVDKELAALVKGKGKGVDRTRFVYVLFVVMVV